MEVSSGRFGWILPESSGTEISISLSSEDPFLSGAATRFQPPRPASRERTTLPSSPRGRLRGRVGAAV